MVLSSLSSAYTEPYKVCPISAVAPKEDLTSDEERGSSEEEDSASGDPSLTHKKLSERKNLPRATWLLLVSPRRHHKVLGARNLDQGDTPAARKVETSLKFSPSPISRARSRLPSAKEEPGRQRKCPRAPVPLCYHWLVTSHPEKDGPVILRAQREKCGSRLPTAGQSTREPSLFSCRAD
ncbi:hypothetical protein J1605_006493 [Eschrichtius robustus]|uniref:Uncharacterized protein n=1 Tax=Eschrichtius robustus TaxID=9764 RepID=A0AB34H1U5_ESCRO|nr:hypothetical protein J1605_006493 [Eschrichtius robustus]